MVPAAAGPTRSAPHLLAAIVAVEDDRFYAHGGVDWRAAAAAAWQDVTSLSFHRGASTIDMQVQRLRQPTAARRSPVAKLAQAVRACQIDRRQSKRDTLVEYLNRAPFGGNLTGAGAASWRYFGRPCSALSLGQAALLAGLPQGPNRLRPDRHPAAAVARRNHVLDRMVALRGDLARTAAAGGGGTRGRGLGTRCHRTRPTSDCGRRWPGWPTRPPGGRSPRRST